jgi:methylthioribose-1-phosphate isomerase
MSSRVETVDSVAGIATAIRDMWVRGAPLIGVPPPMAWLSRPPRSE